MPQSEIARKAFERMASSWGSALSRLSDWMTSQSLDVDSDGSVYRTSPIGGREYVENLEADWLHPGAAAITQGQRIIYDPKKYDDAIVRHERIHVGQNRLLQGPQAYEVAKVLETDPSDWEQWPNYTREAPAYEFGIEDPVRYDSDVSKTERQAADSRRAKHFADYINLLKLKNLGDRGIATIEASVPETMLRRYIRTGHPPVRQPNPILAGPDKF